MVAPGQTHPTASPVFTSNMKISRRLHWKTISETEKTVKPSTENMTSSLHIGALSVTPPYLFPCL